MSDNISDYLASIGRKGGQSTTEKKIAAVKANLEKARAKRKLLYEQRLNTNSKTEK